MLSAKDKEDGRVWMAGCIHNPKSREYICIHCSGVMYHVSEHIRTGEEQVTEHFRHGKRAAHPIRNRSTMQGEALEFILEKLEKEYEMELLTDQLYTTSRGDLATDIVAREHLPGGTYIDTVVQVEDNAFNFNDHLALERALTIQGTYLMTVLCAQGSRNPNAHFYRDEYRSATGKTIKELGKNEKALYERNRANVYFDHDSSGLVVVRFKEYEEVLAQDIVRGEYIIKHAGEILNFELKKESELIRCMEGRFKFNQRENGYGRKIAFPRPLQIDDYFSKESVAAKRQADAEVRYDIDERLGIMLENMPEDQRRELTHKYGAQRLGGFAVL